VTAPRNRGPDAEEAPRGGATSKSTAATRSNVRHGSDGSGAKHPRRPGHAPEHCTTCLVAVAMANRRRLAEIKVLRAGRRVVDLRGHGC
jgi:hypothetical protein